MQQWWPVVYLDMDMCNKNDRPQSKSLSSVFYSKSTLKHDPYYCLWGHFYHLLFKSTSNCLLSITPTLHFWWFTCHFMKYIHSTIQPTPNKQYVYHWALGQVFGTQNREGWPLLLRSSSSTERLTDRRNPGGRHQEAAQKGKLLRRAQVTKAKRPGPERHPLARRLSGTSRSRLKNIQVNAHWTPYMTLDPCLHRILLLCLWSSCVYHLFHRALNYRFRSSSAH